MAYICIDSCAYHLLRLRRIIAESQLLPFRLVCYRGRGQRNLQMRPVITVLGHQQYSGHPLLGLMKMKMKMDLHGPTAPLRLTLLRWPRYRL
jgi:hypothetical protein